MKYQHEFTVKASLSAVAAFHRQSASMGAITPPPVIVQVHHAPPLLSEGDEMDFTLWLGPLPLHWLARIEQVTPISFVDRQVRGPFTQWVHHHTFMPLTETTTAVIDRVEVVPSSHPFWKLVGLGMWLSLPLLFAYRGWKTRRLLGQVASAGSGAVTDSL
jgi:ligand-binding SRPBCC domain-containing protein